MDKKKAFDSSTQWISDEQKIHESADYGKNKKAVDDALSEQQRRVKLVNEYSKDVQKAEAASKSTKQKEQVSNAYGELKEVASHRLGCLQDIAQIASLEDVFNTLSIEFAQRATSLVVDACSEAASSKSDQPEEGASAAGSDGIARAAQSCILAVRNNWNWISKLVKCSDVHLKHVSEYHQFFHEGKEYDKWMPAELNKHLSILQNTSHDENDGQRLLIILKETLTMFLHWQNKINTLFEKSRKIVPVHFRTKALDHYRPVTSLCDYKTNEINIQEGEELTLIDNSKPQIWMVRNMHCTESQVPSVICVIPGPDTEAVTMATRLRLQLLKTWTVCLKNVGQVVIRFFTLVFKDYDENTAKKMRCLTDDDKMRMIQVIQWITDIFTKYWSEDPRYRGLVTNINRSRDTVRENGNPADYDSSFNKEYISRIRCIEDILTHFRNYLKQWETYKLISEASKQSDFMLLVENWETLKYFQTEDVLRKVNLGLEMLEEGSRGGGSSTAQTTTTRTNYGEDEGSFGSGSSVVKTTTTTTKYSSGGEGSYGSGGEGSFGSGGSTEIKSNGSKVTEEEGSFGSGGSEMIVKTVTSTNMAVAGQSDAVDSSETTESMSEGHFEERIESTTQSQTKNGTAMVDEYETTVSSAETEQLMHAEQEERKKFIITGVIDPSSGEEISLDKAVQLRIVNQKEGTYVNSRTGVSITIPEAMNSGKIKVELTTVKKSAEKRSDVGLITVTTQKESRPYTVKAVVDARSDEQLTVDEAMSKGILNQQQGTIKHTLLGKEMSLSDAIDSGLLIVEFDEEYPQTESETITITYAIHAVVDQKSKSKISFGDAVRRGLIDKETGSYFHNKNLENIYIIDAIKKGFIKATVVKDPTSMNIAPENKMVLEKVDLIRKKLINPLKTIAAMREAVEESNNENPGELRLDMVNTDKANTTDVTNLSPRQPGDGTENSNGNQYDNLNKHKNEHNTSEIHDEAYLDKKLVQRMTQQTTKRSVTKVARLFLQSKSIEGSTSQDVRPKEKKSLTSPKISRIPTFKGQHSRIASNKSSMHAKSLSLDHLNTSEHSSDSNTKIYSTSSNVDLNLATEDQLDSGVGQSISDSNLFNQNSIRSTDVGNNNNGVLIYTQEIVSHLPVPVSPTQVPPKVQMCTVGTQCDTDESGSSATGLLFHSKEYKSGSHSSTGALIINESNSTTTTTTNIKEIINSGTTVVSSHDATGQRVATESKTTDSSLIQTGDVDAAGGVTILKGVKETKNMNVKLSGENSDGAAIITSDDVIDGSISTSHTVTEINSHSMNISADGSRTSETKLRKRKSAKHGRKQLKKTEGESDEEFFLATEAGLIAAAAATGGSVHQSGVNMQVMRETLTENRDELLLLQEAIAAIADPKLDESHEKKSALCLRICKACLPLQMLMLLLLGLACLLPMSEEEYSCALANNFENSFTTMLKHKDGPPPF